MEELQKHFACELGSGAVELVIPRRGDKHLGLLQETLARLTQEQRVVGRLLVCRGFGLSAYLFQRVNTQVGHKASVAEYNQLNELLTTQFPRLPGRPIDSARLVGITGPRLLVVHEPLSLESPATALSQFGIESGVRLTVDYIEIDSSLSRDDLLRKVNGFEPTGLVVSYHRERKWRPSDVLVKAPTPVRPESNIWHGRTLFNALHSLITEYRAL